MLLHSKTEKEVRQILIITYTRKAQDSEASLGLKQEQQQAAVAGGVKDLGWGETLQKYNQRNKGEIRVKTELQS